MSSQDEQQLLSLDGAAPQTSTAKKIPRLPSGQAKKKQVALGHHSSSPTNNASGLQELDPMTTTTT